jgi:hypothetical protein
VAQDCVLDLISPSYIGMLLLQQGEFRGCIDPRVSPIYYNTLMGEGLPPSRYIFPYLQHNYDRRREASKNQKLSSNMTEDERYPKSESRRTDCWLNPIMSLNMGALAKAIKLSL